MFPVFFERKNCMKLIALDLDGTTLNSSGQLTYEVAVKLAEISRNRNYKLVFCTGRPLSGIIEVLKKARVPQETLHALCNGTLIQSADGFCLERNGLSFEDYALIQKFCTEKSLTLIAVDESRCYTTNRNINHSVVTFCYLTNNDIHVKEMDAFTSETSFLKLMICEKEEKIRKVKDDISRSFKERFQCVQGHSEFIELSPIGISKGTALSKVADYYKITSENVFVVGDNENDLSMFELYPNSFAVGNAEEDLKEKARWIVPDNDHNGVLEALKIIEKNAR